MLAVPLRNRLKCLNKRFSSHQTHLCVAQMCNYKSSWHLCGAPQFRISKCCVGAGSHKLPCFAAHRARAFLEIFFQAKFQSLRNTLSLSLSEGTWSSYQEGTCLPCHLQHVPVILSTNCSSGKQRVTSGLPHVSCLSLKV